MDYQEIALIVAGSIGSLVAIIHSILVRRLMTRPLVEAVKDKKNLSASAQRLIPLLLDYSGFNWFCSGLALVAAVLWLGPEAKLIAALLAGSAFLFAALGNLWGTRGRHPGWVLYAIAVTLIVIGIT